MMDLSIRSTLIFLAQKYNVSFALNYDGAQKFKSSSMQIWPVQLYLNELHPQIRYVICL